MTIEKESTKCSIGAASSPNESDDNDDDIFLAEESQQKTTARSGCGICKLIIKLYDGNPDAAGFALDSIPRGFIVMGASIFVGRALILLGKQSAGCDTEPEIPGGEIATCTNTVNGIRPSSVLTTSQTVISVLVSCFLPLIGSIIDHTNHRRLVGAVTGAMAAVLVFSQIFINEKNWFSMLIVQIFIAVLYTIHLTPAFAYLPELTTDEAKRVKYYSSFAAVQFGCTIIFLIVVTALSYAFGISEDTIAVARTSQIIVFVVCFLFFSSAWTLCFGPRKASQPVPEGKNIFNAGFIQLIQSVKDIHVNYPAVRWSLCAFSLGEATVSAFVTISITFLTDQLQFTSTEQGFASLIMLTGSLPGAFLGGWVTKRFNPIRSCQANLILWILSLGVGLSVLTGPGQQIRTYIFCALWGVSFGWFYPAEKALYCTIIPADENAELMGIFLWATFILGWLPPLVFTVMNESKVPMRLAFATLCFYWFAAFLFYCLVGNYQDAVEHAKKKNAERREEDELCEERRDGHYNNNKPGIHMDQAEINMDVTIAEIPTP